MKPWYKSKTVWFNILTIGGAVLAGAGGFLPALGPVVSPAVYQWTLFGVGFLNVVLRAITSGPINWKEDVDTGTD
jgi:hypothetical protein